MRPGSCGTTTALSPVRRSSDTVAYEVWRCQCGLLPSGARRAAAGRRRAGPRARALGRGQRRALELRLELRDHVALRLQLPEPPVDLRLHVLDRDVLVEDRAERRVLDERLLDAPDRDADDDVRRAALGAGAVLDAAHVAVEVARQPQGALRRRREVGDLQGQLGLVELRAARRRGQAGPPPRLPGDGRHRRAPSSVSGRRSRRGRQRQRRGASPVERRPSSRSTRVVVRPTPSAHRQRHGDGGRHGDEREPAPGQLAPRARAAARAARRRDRAHARAELGGCVDPRRAGSRSMIASWSGCDICAHPLFELLQRPAQPGRAGGRRDAEDAGGGLDVEVEQHAQRDHLALAGGQRRERALELRREPAEEPVLGVVGLVGRVGTLATAAALLRAEMVERGRARELAQPGAARFLASGRTDATGAAPSRTSRRSDPRRPRGCGSCRRGRRGRRRDDARRRTRSSGLRRRRARRIYAAAASITSHGSNGRLVDPVAADDSSSAESRSLGEHGEPARGRARPRRRPRRASPFRRPRGRSRKRAPQPRVAASRQEQRLRAWADDAERLRALDRRARGRRAHARHGSVRAHARSETATRSNSSASFA